MEYIPVNCRRTLALSLFRWYSVVVPLSESQRYTVLVGFVHPASLTGRV